MILKCISCSFESQNLEYRRCPSCNSFLLIEYERKPKELRRDYREVGVWVYKNFLPEFREKISRGEGNTPLIKANNLSANLGVEIFLKNEGSNPTGSFMDRGSAVYVSFLKEKHINKIKLFTTGNFGCSVTAYATHAGMECEILAHEKTNHFKLLQMIWLGAKVEMTNNPSPIEKNFITQADPFFIEGLKTQMFEIFEQFRYSLPDYITIPVGSGSNLFSYFKAYKELKEMGLIDEYSLKFIGAKPNKEASKIFLDLDPSFLYCKEAIEKLKQENLLIEKEATKEEIMKALSEFSKFEGILVEPASAITLAVLKKLLMKGKLEKGSKVVLLITGTGLKEIGSINLLQKDLKKAKISKEMGYTKLKILSILKENSMSGYEIWKRLRKENIRIRLPTLYEHLKELEELNLITSTITYVNNRKTNIRKLTEYGLKYLESFKGL